MDPENSGNAELPQGPKDLDVDALSIVEDEVRELVRRRGLDPAKQPALMKSLIEDVVRDYDERALLGAVPALGSLEQARRTVYDNVAGFGALQQLLDDPSVEEIWINASKNEYKLVRASDGFTSPQGVRRRTQNVIH